MGAGCCKPEVIDFEGETNLFHFYLLRSVGKGAFGKVRVVQHKQTKQLLALKYINKAKCCKMKAVANIIQERRLLEEIDHPFVVNLRYAFQDDENCFFVLDLMLGGDLRFHIDRMGGFEEKAVRFYVAEIALALDYLHSIRIVHRDLKPDNLLLDENGHVHLTDFNIAVHFSTSGRLLTGVAGSMAYMAPEVLAKKGYSCQIDWWSLGVIVYELMFGKRPFRGKTNSALTESIQGERLLWPDDAQEKCSLEGMSAIKMLLERDPQKRLGWKQGGGGLQDIKRHPWFRDMDWAALEKKELPPPFVPDSKKANFDATHELEELLLEENPLKARKRKENQDPANLSPDMRTMEEHFKVYDSRRMARKSYYHPPSDQATSKAQTTSTVTAVSSISHLSKPGMERGGSETPTTQLVSRSGVHVESLIADGGGIQDNKNTGIEQDAGTHEMKRIDESPGRATNTATRYPPSQPDVRNRTTYTPGPSRTYSASRSSGTDRPLLLSSGGSVS